MQALLTERNETKICITGITSNYLEQFQDVLDLSANISSSLIYLTGFLIQISCIMFK